MVSECLNLYYTCVAPRSLVKFTDVSEMLTSYVSRMMCKPCARNLFEIQERSVAYLKTRKRGLYCFITEHVTDLLETLQGLQANRQF
jgi:hypothetical protein